MRHLPRRVEKLENIVGRRRGGGIFIVTPAAGEEGVYRVSDGQKVVFRGTEAEVRRWLGEFKPEPLSIWFGFSVPGTGIGDDMP